MEADRYEFDEHGTPTGRRLDAQGNVLEKGVTARQLKAAPQGATFVVRHPKAARYTADLAAHLGRADITCVPVGMATELELAKTAGQWVVDHDCRLPEGVQHLVDAHNASVGAGP